MEIDVPSKLATDVEISVISSVIKERVDCIYIAI